MSLDLLTWLPIIILSITIHEFSHSYVADKLGDTTPRFMGRLSLNPIVHLDPVGMVMLILVHFGWAKPVPINPRNFQNPLKGMALVGLAGPVSNLCLAWFFSMILRYVLPLFPPLPLWAFQMILHAIWLNIALALFNFIPVPPLDGSRILNGLLPPVATQKLAELERYGFLLIVVILLMPGPSDLLLSAVHFFYQLFTL